MDRLRIKRLSIIVFGMAILFLMSLLINFDHFVFAQATELPDNNYLPLIKYAIMRSPTPTLAPTPTPIPADPLPGTNIQCKTYGNAEICASVSNSTPSQYSWVTVYGRLVINNSAQVGKTM